MKGRINIGVTGTGSLIGQAVIKSIQRSGLKDRISITGFDYFTDTVGSFWCDANYVLPDILKPETTEEAWLEFITGKISENDIRLLFIGVDFELALFSRYKSRIESKTGAVVLVSSEEVIAIADDKYLTYEFLKKNKLPHPLSFLPGDAGVKTLEYPLIVKPRKGARSVGVTKVNKPGELQAALENAKDPLIQEYIGTEKDEFTCGTIFLDGNLERMIVLNRTLKAGNTYISNYSNNFPASITDYLKQVTMLLKPFGACNFQLRLDKNGVPKIFEINARHSGTTYIRSLFGYMEVEFIINKLLFSADQAFELREGTVVRYYDEFFVPEKASK